MMFSEYAKTMAGRWMDRSYRPPVEGAAGLQPVAARQVKDADSREDGTGMWLAAGVIDVHDEINVSGEWLPVTGTEITKPDYDRPGSAVLEVPGGALCLDYTARVYARDAAEPSGSQARGAR